MIYWLDADPGWMPAIIAGLLAAGYALIESWKCHPIPGQENIMTCGIHIGG